MKDVTYKRERENKALLEKKKKKKRKGKGVFFFGLEGHVHFVLLERRTV